MIAIWNITRVKWLKKRNNCKVNKMWTRYHSYLFWPNLLMALFSTAFSSAIIIDDYHQLSIINKLLRRKKIWLVFNFQHKNFRFSHNVNLISVSFSFVLPWKRIILELVYLSQAWSPYFFSSYQHSYRYVCN